MGGRVERLDTIDDVLGDIDAGRLSIIADDQSHGVVVGRSNLNRRGLVGMQEQTETTRGFDGTRISFIVCSSRRRVEEREV